MAGWSDPNARATSAPRGAAGDGAAATSAFMELVDAFWHVVNSKNVSSNHPLGRAARAGGGGPEPLRAFAAWAEGCSFTRQAAHALAGACRCLASAIDDLPTGGYSFVLASRFQSDPLEGRFGCWRQVPGGRPLMPALAARQPEKIKKIEALLKAGVGPEGMMAKPGLADVTRLEGLIAHIDINRCQPLEKARPAAAHAAGFDNVLCNRLVPVPRGSDGRSAWQASECTGEPARWQAALSRNIYSYSKGRVGVRRRHRLPSCYARATPPARRTGTREQMQHVHGHRQSRRPRPGRWVS